jgi:hypothetical protein
VFRARGARADPRHGGGRLQGSEAELAEEARLPAAAAIVRGTLRLLGAEIRAVATRIAIVGGGIGGLAAACSCARPA